MKRALSKIILLGLLLPLFLKAEVTKTPPHKQESSRARDWVASWRTCSGDGAVKQDGTLWQFGRVGGCMWGQIIPIDPYTGEPSVTKIYRYHLHGREIGRGFADAKIINGKYRVYAIKKEGTLWGWGERLGEKPILLSHSRKWIDFRVKFEGNGCCAYDVGMQKDGTLWRFPEGFDYTHKNPISFLKKIGREKGWDKVLLTCCTIYATRKDGTLWKNSGFNAKVPFKQTSYASLCTHHLEVCNKLKAMPHHTLFSSDENEIIFVNTSGRAGTLWLDPEVIYR